MGTAYILRSNEETEQEAVMQWARMSEGRWPELHLLHHIPNGGSRNKREAARLKRMGVLAGVADLHLPVARGGYHGLYIELKYGDGKLRQTQKDFLKLAAAEGVYCCVCYTADDAIEIITEYMKRDVKYPNLAIIKGGDQTGTVE